jgi:uncharacterized protein (DUF2336 family)
MTHVRKNIVTQDKLSTQGPEPLQQSAKSPFALLPPAHRARVAATVAANYNPIEMSEHELAVAKSIVAEALIDAAVLVRQALMEALLRNPLAPPDVLKALAEDTDLIAVPVIEVCESLQPDDIIDILERSRSKLKMCAVARRRKLPEQISSFLCDYGDADVITELFQNLSAEITSDAIARALHRHGNAKSVQTALASRPSVPLAVIDRLLELIAARVDHIAQDGDNLQEPQEEPGTIDSYMSPEKMLAAMIRPAQRALIGLSSTYSDFEVFTMIGHLETEGRLSDSMILRSLCLGNLQFFAAALAVKAKMPNRTIVNYVQAADALKLKKAIISAKLPDTWSQFVLKAIQIVIDSQSDAAQLDLESFRSRLHERIISIVEFADIKLSIEDIDAIMEP